MLEHSFCQCLDLKHIKTKIKPYSIVFIAGMNWVNHIKELTIHEKTTQDNLGY